MKRLSSAFWTTLSLLLVAASPVVAEVKYWDINGTSPGATDDGGGFVDQDWTDTVTNWNTDPTGGNAGIITNFNDGDDAIFSAGTNAVDGIILIPAGQQQAPNSITIEEGQIAFSNANSFAMGANSQVIVREGATLQIPNLNVFAVTGANHQLVLDGGTFRNTIVGVGSGIYSTPADATGNTTKILLTEKGGTISTPTGGNNAINGAYSIMVYGGVNANPALTSLPIIGMTPGTTSATLRKTGHGEFRGLANYTFTNLVVEEGLYRINGTGGAETGFGAVDGTVTTMGGAQANTTNGSALGTSVGIVSPATRSFVLGGTGDTMFVLNAGWTINGAISGAGGLMLNGWTRNDTNAVIGSQTQPLTLGGANTYAGPTTINFGTLVANGGSAIPDSSKVVISTNSTWGVTALNTAVLTVNASETIGNLEGGNATRGTVNIVGAATTLSIGADNGSSTFSGAVNGTGSLAKTGTGTLTLDGAKAYTGNTSVLTGTLSTNSASLADLADVLLSTGSIFNLNFAGPDTIDSLLIDGVAQAIGTWGGAGSGATNISSLLTGTGILNVTSSGAVGVPGDYNNNGTVDFADYDAWKAAFGTNTVLPNDPTPGVVDAADYTFWRDRKSTAGETGSGAAVPEPTSIAACSILFVLGALLARRSTN